MKVNLIFLISIFGQYCFAQSSEFSFLDKSFKIGATKTIYSDLYCIKPFRCTCDQDSNGVKAFDSLVEFLKKNPDLILEIGCHLDTQADDEYNL
jgi:hypothetical protein